MLHYKVNNPATLTFNLSSWPVLISAEPVQEATLTCFVTTHNRQCFVQNDRSFVVLLDFGLPTRRAMKTGDCVNKVPRNKIIMINSEET